MTTLYTKTVEHMAKRHVAELTILNTLVDDLLRTEQLAVWFTENGVPALAGYTPNTGLQIVCKASWQDVQWAIALLEETQGYTALDSGEQYLLLPPAKLGDNRPSIQLGVTE